MSRANPNNNHSNQPRTSESDWSAAERLLADPDHNIENTHIVQQIQDRNASRDAELAELVNEFAWAERRLGHSIIHSCDDVYLASSRKNSGSAYIQIDNQQVFRLEDMR